MNQKSKYSSFFAVLSILLATVIIGCGTDDDEGGTNEDDTATNGDAGTESDASSSTDDTDTTDEDDSDTGTESDTSSTNVFPADVTTPRILIVGDSISAGPGCWKKYALGQLEDNGYTQFEFVGPYTDDCGSSIVHGAVSCSTAEQYTEESFTMTNCRQGEYFDGLSVLVEDYDPDLILLQLGVNDIWSGETSTVQPVLDSYTTLVEQARAHNPNIVIVVAQIHKVITIPDDEDTDCSGPVNPAAEELINAVPAWAEEIDTPESPIFVADLWTNSDPSNASDCVHPNTTGAKQMGEDWYNAIKDILPKE